MQASCIPQMEFVHLVSCYLYLEKGLLFLEQYASLLLGRDHIFLNNTFVISTHTLVMQESCIPQMEFVHLVSCYLYLEKGLLFLEQYASLLLDRDHIFLNNTFVISTSNFG